MEGKRRERGEDTTREGKGTGGKHSKGGEGKETGRRCYKVTEGDC